MLQRLWTRLAGLALRGYPRAWRERYEQEMRALIQGAPVRPATVIDLTRGALRERGVYLGTWWTARLVGRIALAWLVAIASVAALWTVFVVTFAPFGAEWFGFDRQAWVADRLGETRMVLRTATFYVLPSVVFALPVVVLLFILRTGRRPWLARAATLGSMVLFCVWWDGTLFFSFHHGWRSVWSPEFGHFAAVIAGWLVAVWLFPRRSGVSGRMANDGSSAESPGDSASSPPGIFRDALAPKHHAV